MKSNAKPIIPALTLVLIASCPSVAPTTCDDTSSSSTGRAPIRIAEARFFASSISDIPSITPSPSVIALLTLGTLMNSPS